MCSISANLVCPNEGSEIADNVTGSADAVQLAFMVKSLLKAGVLSLAAIAAILKKNPDDIAKVASKVFARGCFVNGQCLEYAQALKRELAAAGIAGEIRQLSSETGQAIMKAGEEGASNAVALRGFHYYGVQVGDMIYELNSTKGIPVNQWASMYTTLGSDGVSIVPTVLVSIPK